MPTQRPFFSNFLAAFRAQSALQKAATSSATSSATASAAQSSFTTSSTTSSTAAAAAAATAAARSIATKATSPSSAATSSSIAIPHQFQPQRHHAAASPYSRSPGPGGSSSPVGQTGSRQRRGSDSSSEGFRDVMSASGEKWYIGGRAANGEERFYRLGVVKRPRSVDRLSLDRLSL